MGECAEVKKCDLCNGEKIIEGIKCPRCGGTGYI